MILICDVKTQLSLIPGTIDLKFIFLHPYKPIRADHGHKDKHTQQQDKEQRMQNIHKSQCHNQQSNRKHHMKPKRVFLDAVGNEWSKKEDL